jgi:hypothetical protein
MSISLTRAAGSLNAAGTFVAVSSMAWDSLNVFSSIG